MGTFSFVCFGRQGTFIFCYYDLQRGRSLLNCIPFYCLFPSCSTMERKVDAVYTKKNIIERRPYNGCS